MKKKLKDTDRSRRKQLVLKSKFPGISMDDVRINSPFKKLLFIFLLFFIVVIFFYPIFKGYIPFPGDLLVGHHYPYNAQSYEGYAPGGVPHKAQGPDVIRQLFPWKYFVIESFKQWQIPFWNPHNFSGNPLMANFQSGVFYPLNFVFFLLPFNIAWTVYIFLTPFLTALFLYLYLREIGLKSASSFFGGVVFAFSSYMVVWMEYGNIGHTLLWLPLSLFLIERLLKKFDRRTFLLLIFTLTVSLLGGYIQGYFYISGTLFLYITIKMWSFIRFQTKRFFLLSSSFIIPIFLTLFQFFPTVSLFSQSSRGNYSLDTIDKLLNPWWYVVTVIVPDFFGNPASRNYWFDGTYIERVSFFGVIPFIFALTALFYWQKRTEVRIFGIIFFSTFLLSFNIIFTKFFYLIPIPVISTTVPTRILCLFVFSGSVLSAIGLHELLQRPKQKVPYYALGITGLLLLIGWTVVLGGDNIFSGQNWISNLPVSKRNMLLPTAFTIIIWVCVIFYQRISHFKMIFLCLVFFLSFFDLFRFFHKITPFSPESYVYPQTQVITYIQKMAGINRFWGYGSAHIDTNFQMYDRTYIPDGNDPLHILPYTTFIESSKDGSIPKTAPRADANIAPGYGPDDLKGNAYRQKVLNLLGVKYIVHKFDAAGQINTPDEVTMDPKKYKLVWQEGQYQIYENLLVAPRAFLTTDYRILKKSEIIPEFYKTSFNEKKTILLEEDPNIEKNLQFTGTAKVLTYSPNRIIIETHATAKSLLFLSDTMYPGWEASVDGLSQKIYTANYAFRAVPVPKGVHRIEFVYKSPPFMIGLLLSGVTFITLSFFYFSLKGKSL